MGRKKTLRYAFVLALCLGLAACGGSSGAGDGDGGETNGETDGGDTGTGSDTIATVAGSVFPIDLAIASPYESSSASASISVGRAIEDFQTERVEIQRIVGGAEASDCGFTLNLFLSASASPGCYGPQVTYQNHPDGADQNPAVLPGNDLGVWDESQDGEACAAAKLNQLVESVATKVDSAVSIFASMACTLNVNSLELPAVGASLDLADEFNSIITQNNIAGLSVASATLSRASDDAGGNEIYDFAFTGSASEGANSRSIELYLRHIPLDDDNATYKGKLSFVFSYTDESGGNSADAGSVLYHKSSATVLDYRLQEATYVGNPGVTPDPLSDTTRDIDPTISGNTDSARGWNNNFNYIVARINPRDGTGSVGYSWLAGNNNENTRTFNATVLAADDGSKTGCAYYGYGQPIGSGTLGAISGMICNWAAPGATEPRTMHETVQRQCVAENASGVFTSDSSTLRMTYAPTNSCDSAAGDNFTFQTTAGTATNDHTVGTAGVTSNLLPIADMSFTLPTAPGDVY